MKNISEIIERAFLDRGLTGTTVDSKLSVQWVCDGVKEAFMARPELRFIEASGYYATTLAETEEDIPDTLEEFAPALQAYVLFRYRMNTGGADAAQEFQQFMRLLGVQA